TFERSDADAAVASADGSAAPMAPVFNQILATSLPVPSTMSYATTTNTVTPGSISFGNHVTAELLRVETPMLYLAGSVPSLVHTAPPNAEVEFSWMKLKKYPPVVLSPPREETFNRNEA